MAQITIDADSDSNGVRNTAESTWTAARSATTGSTTTFVIDASNSATFQCGRYFGLFDLSGIAAGSTITAATFVHPAISNNTNDNSITVHVGEHTATDPIDGNSYNDLTLDSDTSFGSVAVSGLSTSGTTNITLDAGGLSYLQGVIGSTAKLSLRSDLDRDNSSPAGINQYTISVTAPDLIVTYTPPEGGEQGYSFFL